MAVGNYVAGILVALVSTFLSATGLALQKKTHQELQAKREEARRKGILRARELRSFRQWKWRLGLVFLIGTALASLAVFTLLGQAVASAMAAVTMIWNVGWSVFYLHEPLLVIDVISTTLLLIGSVVAVVFGRKGTTTSSFFSPSDIESVFHRTVPIIAGAIVGVIMAVLLLYVWYIRYITSPPKQHPARASKVTSPLTAGEVQVSAIGTSEPLKDVPLTPREHAVIGAAGQVYGKPMSGAGMAAGDGRGGEPAAASVTSDRSYPFSRPKCAMPARPPRFMLKLNLLARIALAGIFAAWTGTASKGTTTQIAYAFKYGEYVTVLSYAGFYLFVAGLITSIILQVYFLNSSLKIGDSTEVIPQYQALIVLLGVAWGYLFFNEGAGKGAGDVIVFWIGGLLIVIGMALLMLKKRPELPARRRHKDVQRFIERHSGKHWRGTRLRRVASSPALLQLVGGAVRAKTEEGGSGQSAGTATAELPHGSSRNGELISCSVIMATSSNKKQQKQAVERRREWAFGSNREQDSAGAQTGLIDVACFRRHSGVRRERLWLMLEAEYAEVTAAVKKDSVEAGTSAVPLSADVSPAAEQAAAPDVVAVPSPQVLVEASLPGTVIPVGESSAERGEGGTIQETGVAAQAVGGEGIQRKADRLNERALSRLLLQPPRVIGAAHGGGIVPTVPQHALLWVTLPAYPASLSDPTGDWDAHCSIEAGLQLHDSVRLLPGIPILGANDSESPTAVTAADSRVPPVGAAAPPQPSSMPASASAIPLQLHVRLLPPRVQVPLSLYRRLPLVPHTLAAALRLRARSRPLLVAAQPKPQLQRVLIPMQATAQLAVLPAPDGAFGPVVIAEPPALMFAPDALAGA